MSDWIPIRYLGFWDIPRNFLVRHEGELYLFDCPFDGELDDFPDSYTVYIMPELTADEIGADWAALPGKAIRTAGKIPIASVRFDPTRRTAIGAEVFDAFPVPSSANGEQTHVKPRSPVR